MAERTLLENAGRVRVGEDAVDLIERSLEHTLSTNVVGLVSSPLRLAEMLQTSAPVRPLVSAARAVELTSSRLAHPKISSRLTRPCRARRRPLSGSVKRRRYKTTIRVPGVRVASDLVERDFNPPAPEYVPTWQGTLCLASVIDCYSRLVDALPDAGRARRRRPRDGDQAQTSDREAGSDQG